MELSRSVGERAHDAFVAVNTDEDEGEDRDIDRDVGDKGAELAHEGREGPALQDDGLETRRIIIFNYIDNF